MAKIMIDLQNYRYTLIVCVALCLTSLANAQEKPVDRGEIALPDQVTFNAHIRPIMSGTCFACHGPDEASNDSGLRLDTYEAAVEISEAIVPGDSADSLFYQRITDTDDPMPPAKFLHQLSDREKALFKRWIDQGAKYEKHWSYSPLKQPVIPKLTKHQSHVANPIDAFVLSGLEAKGIAPSEQADRRTLLRRLSLDLIGLPPTQYEIESFLADQSPDAYEKQVDRLLASPHYGERMATRWLDLVRFSDTVGFHGDQNQRIFPYRDFVIESLNSNQPFDEFTREQLAGDLLDEPTEQQLTATGLIRLNMMTREGGAQPKEYIAKYTADRVRMVGTAFLGATLGCCECHDHKYDPFSAKDFYSLGAFFADVRQWGVYNDYRYTPNPDLAGYNNNYPFPPELRVRSKSLMEQIKFLERKLDRRAASLVKTKNLDSPKFKKWLSTLTKNHKTNPDLWNPIEPLEVKHSDKTKHELLGDNSIRFSGKPASEQIYVDLTAKTERLIRSLRMEVLPDATNSDFVGRGKAGHFNVKVSLQHLTEEKLSQPPIPLKPRFVRIKLPGRKKILSLAEVQVFARDSKENLALGGTATQSSTDFKGEANLAIDDRTAGDNSKGPAVTHSKNEKDPWWELDLGSEQSIESIVIWNRTDSRLGGRLKGYQVTLLDKDRKVVHRPMTAFPAPSHKIGIPKFVTPGEESKLKIAFTQADLFTPRKFSNGKPDRYVSTSWRSGPMRWQLPLDEATQKHTAVHHLDRPIRLAKGDRLRIAIASSDIGRVRFSTSPLSRNVVGQSAASDDLAAALNQLASNNDLKLVEEPQLTSLKSAYYRHITPFRNDDGTVRNLRNAIADCFSGFAMTLVTQPVDEKLVLQSRVLPRGDWKNESGEVVLPDTPGFLPRQAPGENSSKRKTRLDLANWITSPENPLTARHFANRTWSHFFGTGLSNVLDDLGNQGEWPSHPGLLNWLACEFRKDWDRKNIVRLIVTSNTYRQRAASRKELLDLDPGNRWLAQQSARRLEAEAVRDNALAISGLLNVEWIGGRSVFPFQPAGYYSNIQFPNRSYRAQSNGLQYRRGLYMHWQRTFLHPMLTNFDAPSRDECTADRTESNSPQQALTLLNDPVFVEASRAFALRIAGMQSSHSPRAAIENAFEIALAREATDAEVESLVKLYQSQYEYFKANPNDAKKFNRVGAIRSEESLNDISITAMAQVCRVILNLHEVITRY